MPSTSLSRRRFLQTVAATTAVGPFMSIRPRAAGPTLRHASIGASGQAFSDLKSFATHPSFELVAVADVDLCRFEALQKAFPKARVYQDWRELLEKEHTRIDSVNVSVPDHMHCLVAHGGDEARQACLRPEAALQHAARDAPADRGSKTAEADDADGDSGVVQQAAALRRSPRPQRHRRQDPRGAHILEQELGGRKAAARGTDPVPAPLEWDEWLGVSDSRPFKKGVYHPGEWRKRIGFGTGTLGDMGCHIYSPPYRALGLTSPISVTGDGPSPTAENWAVKAKVKVTYPGTQYTAGPTVDVWWYDGGELPPDAIREPLGTRLPEQGSVVVGTDGLIVLPHMTADAFVLPESKMAKLPQIDLPDRNHYHEFIDVVMGGGRRPVRRASTTQAR